MSANRPRRIDKDNAEQLFSGALTGSSGAGDPLADLLAAAAAPARPDELAGELAAMAAFRVSQLDPVPQPRRPSMIKIALAKVLTVKVGVACAVVLAAGGGVAYASSPSAPSNPLNHTKPVASSSAEHPNRPTPPAHPSLPPMPSLPALPDPTTLKLQLLCDAYLHLPSGQPEYDAYVRAAVIDHEVFQIVVEKAGGKDPAKVEAYCTKLLADHPLPEHPTAPPSGWPSLPPRPSAPPTPSLPPHPSGYPTPSYPGH